MAITGLNTLLYSTEVEALHAVMRDVFDLPQEDVDPDWIHFDCPPTRMELHLVSRTLVFQLAIGSPTRCR